MTVAQVADTIMAIEAAIAMVFLFFLQMLITLKIDTNFELSDFMSFDSICLILDF